jgi:RimJ/RimL family protein N-acetyltransferase
VRLETERLLLRPPTVADVAAPPHWLTDPEVMDWLGGVEPPEEVVRRWLADWERFPSGKFLVERREDGVLVGRVGANYYDPATWRRTPDGVPELGWALAREHWGRGYATEAAFAVRAWLAAPRVLSLIAPANLRSQAVARRLGAEPGETVELPDGAGPHVVWVHRSEKIGQR